MGWLDHISGRLLVTIADQHLRPPRHAEGCAKECAPRCPIREYEARLDRPVFASEIAAAERDEERWMALARGDFSHLEGAGDEAGSGPQ